MNVKVLHQDVDISYAKDKTLPLNSYVVCYYYDGSKRYDIVISNRQADIFDMYWDLYRNNIISIKWTDGKVNPKLWQDPKAKSKTK